jgi:hypothetical protein
MAWVNEHGYIVHQHGPTRTGRLPKRFKGRNWWLLKSSREDMRSQLDISICFPPNYFGKRIRLKVEVIEDETKDRI